MKCESALEGWKIRKRIESGAYLGRKVIVAESLLEDVEDGSTEDNRVVNMASGAICAVDQS
jgi:hypothetical protein